MNLIDQSHIFISTPRLIDKKFAKSLATRILLTTIFFLIDKRLSIEFHWQSWAQSLAPLTFLAPVEVYKNLLSFHLALPPQQSTLFPNNCILLLLLQTSSSPESSYSLQSSFTSESSYSLQSSSTSEGNYHYNITSRSTSQHEGYRTPLCRCRGSHLSVRYSCPRGCSRCSTCRYS